MKNRRYLTSSEAADALNVSPSTLYSYVSRGMVRSEAGTDGRRKRMYRSEDIERLKARKRARRNPGWAVRRALHTGDPILESAITLITDERVCYRGRDALKLAATESFERVAALIWTGDPKFSFPILAHGFEHHREARQYFQALRPVDRFQALLPLAEAEDPAALDLRPAAVAATGMRILWFMTGVVTGEDPVGGIARAVRKAWAADIEGAVELINTTLVLFADHELNVSTFTARCAASSGATPYSAVCAGLAALRGYKHGAANERVELLFKEVESTGDVERTVVGRLRRGEGIPGFGHAVYRDVDPRAKLLLDMLEDRFPGSKDLHLVREIIDTTHRLITDRYNIDVALTALVRVLNMPEGSGMALFALGRTAGWIGHAIEQYERDQLIRPRARYIGLRPPNVPSA
ncbi:MAG: citrate synthase family protein [Gammaproteobacteria bacterium]|nr:citrate synthase family protein [Gammaproteobacteria bacterium]